MQDLAESVQEAVRLQRMDEPAGWALDHVLRTCQRIDVQTVNQNEVCLILRKLSAEDLERLLSFLLRRGDAEWVVLARRCRFVLVSS
jgi:hypothetical protein